MMKNQQFFLKVALKNVLLDRDIEILHVLLTKVRFLSLRQIADAFFAGDMANAVRRLETLEERGFLVSFRLNARTPAPVNSPLVIWTPGSDQPSASRIAYCLGKRWLRQGTRMRLCYFVGPRFEAMTGIPCRAKPLHTLQASHDLGLAELFLYFRQNRSEDAILWRGENASDVTDLKSQRPDAVLLDSSGYEARVIEYGGLYNAKRLDRLHRCCKQRSLPYELW